MRTDITHTFVRMYIYIYSKYIFTLLSFHRIIPSHVEEDAAQRPMCAIVGDISCRPEHTSPALCYVLQTEVHSIHSSLYAVSIIICNLHIPNWSTERLTGQWPQHRDEFKVSLAPHRICVSSHCFSIFGNLTLPAPACHLQNGQGTPVTSVEHREYRVTSLWLQTAKCNWLESFVVWLVPVFTLTRSREASALEAPSEKL